MAAKQPPQTISRDFTYSTDADLNGQIAAFSAEHQRSAGQRLAMDARRPLGAGKVRVTFRVVAGKGRG
jgi:hypothetical protein